jgi:hypothetical protein
MNYLSLYPDLPFLLCIIDPSRAKPGVVEILIDQSQALRDPNQHQQLDWIFVWPLALE